MSFTIKALVSLNEASKIIGTKGNRIQKIRDSNNNIKIGISERKAGCSDRILLCSSQNVADVSNALGDIVATLLEPDDEHTTSSSSSSSSSTFPFLKSMLPPPNPIEVGQDDLSKIGNIRIILKNSQCSIVIGSKGEQIKRLIEQNGVKMVVSKNYLPDSQERILEIQGFPKAISATILDIIRLLQQQEPPEGTNERSYTPHLGKKFVPKGKKEDYLKITNENGQVTEYKRVISVPEEYVSSLIGLKGVRINSLRSFTRTKITVGDTVSPDGKIEFEILGRKLQNVQLAETKLLDNLETEMIRRKERMSTQNAMQDTVY